MIGWHGRRVKTNRRRVDRYLFYVLRCAVYYASSEKHDLELLKWWNWKYAE